VGGLNDGEIPLAGLFSSLRLLAGLFDLGAGLASLRLLGGLKLSFLVFLGEWEDLRGLLSRRGLLRFLGLSLLGLRFLGGLSRLGLRPR